MRKVVMLMVIALIGGLTLSLPYLQQVREFAGARQTPGPR